MKNNIISLKAVVLIAASLFTINAGASVIDFEDVELTSAFMPTPSTDGTNDWYTSGGNFAFTSGYGGYFWYGFKASKATDNTNKTYTNDCCSVMGGGSSSVQYAVLYSAEYMQTKYSFLFDDAVALTSIDITNTAYTYESLANGDSMASSLADVEGAAHFGVNFRAITGTDVDGNYTYSDVLTFNLGSKNAEGVVEIVDSWETFSLASLNTVDGAYGLEMSFSYSDNLCGTFGVNTPTYVAIDNITYAAVPEPATFAAIAGLMTVAFVAWRKRR